MFVFFFVFFFKSSGSHPFFRPWETADQVQPQQVPVAQQAPLPPQPAHGALEPAQAPQLAPDYAHQANPNGGQPAPDVRQHGSQARLSDPEVSQPVPEARQPASDVCQHGQDAQLPAADAHQLAPSVHQLAPVVPQPAQDSPYLHPHPQYPAGLTLANMHKMHPGIHDPSTGAPPYFPWTPSMNPPMPAQHGFGFPAPPAPWSPRFLPPIGAPQNPIFAQQSTSPFPPTPPMAVKAQHDILLEQISKLCRKSGSQWIVAISEDYMKQVQRIEKRRTNALKQRPGDPSVHPHYDQQRLQLIEQIQSQLQAFRENENSNDPGTSKDSSGTQGTSKDANSKAGTSNDTSEEQNANNTSDDGGDTYSSEDDSADEPDGSSNAEAASTSTSRFSSKTKQVLETWYVKHLDRPYAGSDVKKLAKKAGITEKQTKKWLSNRRTRDKNTRSRKQDNTPAQQQYYMGGPGYYPYWQ